MRFMLFFSLLTSFALPVKAYAQTSTVTGDEGKTYHADMRTGDLTVSWEEGGTVLADIVGYIGQTSKVLVSFNGTPALAYESVGSNTSFEVFYTLTQDETPVVDCAYANICNGQNGASIRKAVCNLGAPLTKDYQDLIFRYSDKWIEASNSISLKSLVTEPAAPVNVPLGQLGEVSVALHYSSLDDLISATPRTIVMTGLKNYEASSGKAYLVYDVDGTTPLALDVEIDPIKHTLKRFTPAEMLFVIEGS